MSFFGNGTTVAPTALDAIFVNPEQRFVAIVVAVSLALVVALLICLYTIDWLMARFKWRWKANPVSADRRQALAVIYASSNIAFYIVRAFYFILYQGIPVESPYLQMKLPLWVIFRCNDNESGRPGF
jgi:amino acid transporter